jgi:hypothetical protein
MKKHDVTSLTDLFILLSSCVLIGNKGAKTKQFLMKDKIGISHIYSIAFETD